MNGRQRLAALVLISALLGAGAWAAEGPPRQYYSGWRQAPQYYYRFYFFKPKPTDTVYHYQYVIWKPQRTREWVYWYSPKAKKYWARCPTRENRTYGKQVLAGKDLWSLLPDEFRRDNLNNIKDEHFGEVREGAPPIPESEDKRPIDCVPADLPEG